MDWPRLAPFLILDASFLVGGMAGWLIGMFFPRYSPAKSMRLSLACALVGSICTLIQGVVFWNHPMMQSYGAWQIPVLDFRGLGVYLSIYVDRLAAFFLLMIGFLSTGIVIYSYAWLADKEDGAPLAGAYNLVILCASTLVIINDAFFFVVVMELMTLAFGYLTLYKHNQLVTQPNLPIPQEINAAKLAFKNYLVFSHLGSLLIALGFILLLGYRGQLPLDTSVTSSQTTLRNERCQAVFDQERQSTGFDILRSYSTSAPEPENWKADAIFLIFLAGFGIKSAMAPFHPWMALTHPFLPTNVHALVSSVVVKSAGIYGLVRVLFQFLPGQVWWGWLLLLIAVLTAFVGVFNALISRDLKTALANHSVENIGIILAGIGTALMFKNMAFGGQAILGLAQLSLIAAFYHLVNHSLFKSLLFLGAGAMEKRTGTLELEKLGGLVHLMPLTSTLFLVGSISISGFPPFNGFISEWLLLQSIFAGMVQFNGSANIWLVMGLLAALVLLGLSFGMTALAFVKICGEVLLGAPRFRGGKWKEFPMMWLPMFVLAGLCLLLGILPGWMVLQLQRLTVDFLPTLSTTGEVGLIFTMGSPFTLVTQAGNLSLALNILPLLLIAFLLGLLIAWFSRRKRPVGRAPAWNGGTPLDPDTMQMTTGAFSSLVWDVLMGTGRKTGRWNMPGEPEIIPWQLPISARRVVTGVVRRLMNKMVNWMSSSARVFGDWFQRGDIRSYLLYLFLAFIAVLLASIVLSRRGW